MKFCLNCQGTEARATSSGRLSTGEIMQMGELEDPSALFGAVDAPSEECAKCGGEMLDVEATDDPIGDLLSGEDPLKGVRIS